MDSFNASVLDESKSQLAVEGRSKGQCTAMLSPPVGTLKLVAGNGTSVGTVMTLQCPYTHRPVNGGRVICMEDNDRTQWSGGVPECKPLSRHESPGFRLAVLVSTVSLAIIIFMSVIFITSCLLKHVKREEMKRRERERKRETAELWAQMDHQNVEEQSVAFHGRKGRNNNNNNNSSGGGSAEQHTQRPVAPPAASTQQPGSHLPTACRCPQECLRTCHPSERPAGPVPSATSHVDTQTSCALLLPDTHLQTFPCNGCDHTLEQRPRNRPLPVAQSPHLWVISV
ncbi:uncharacterized protein LOC143502117 isoform X1 [Brachyhypopomus gauderio]|uniref:uncharacterized protein LOC143502117 isoform X1 n=2 Tax=Brachyhypopomus gauderio TaxID=698409 RepID=UPI0040423E24